MKYLICSDIHGNLPAFEKMIEVEKDYDQFICLGDIVNYGPWSNECVDLALTLPNALIIKGNHEEYFINGFYPKKEGIVNDFFNQTYSSFNRLPQIKNLPDNIQLNEFILTHTLNNSYIYPDTKIKLDNNYIIGHSHHQFKYENNNFALYNVGSVGQNRKYINVINYILFNSQTNVFELKQTTYDVNQIIDKMISLNYPQTCIEYYKLKQILGN
jgi:predicted phosphodiesterase